ncbi:MAG: ParB/RepB/Spo0J family partition protein [Planctomycetota bacterium]
MPEKTSQQRRHLGKGLEALMGPITRGAVQPGGAEPAPGTSKFPPDKELHKSLRQISVDSVKPNPYQPRMIYNDEDLRDLADSIGANGVIQPVLVRETEAGYEVIAGQRRLKAAKLAGLEDVPALVRDADDSEMLELALVENIHRTDLNPIERAKAYQNFLETFALTQAEAARRLGEDRSVIANYIRLLDLPGEIKQMLTDGSISMGHARAILALPTDDLRKKLANRALAGRLSVREVERLVRKALAGPKDSSQNSIETPPHIIDLEKRLQSLLGTKVSIATRKRGQRGRIIIDFYSLDEFDRLTEKMGLNSTESM